MTAPIHTGYGIRATWGDSWFTSCGEKWLDVFSQRAYRRWKDFLPPGTKMLLYQGSGYGGSKSITAAAMVQGRFIHNEERENPGTEDWREQWCWCLPVITIVERRNVTPVLLERIREIIEPEKAGRPYQARFPRHGEVWRPITKDLYDALMAKMLPN